MRILEAPVISYNAIYQTVKVQLLNPDGSFDACVDVKLALGQGLFDKGGCIQSIRT